MRLTANNVDKFQHDGLVVDRGWTQFNYAKADPKAQASFRDHVGRFVQIHPDDYGELAKLGLAFEGGRIVEIKPEPGEGKGKGENGSAKGAGEGKTK